MTIETVISQDTAQIRVIGEEDAVHVVGLTLEPIGAIIQERHTRDRRGLIGIRLDTDSPVVSHRKQVVHDFETVRTRGVIDTADIRDAGELRGRVVLEEGEDRNNDGGRDVDGEFVLPHGELLDVLRKTRDQVFAVLVEVVGEGNCLLGGVDDGAADSAGGCGGLLEARGGTGRDGGGGTGALAVAGVGGDRAIWPLGAREVGAGGDGSSELGGGRG